MSRPFLLDPLFRGVIALPGIGPRNAVLFEKLTGGPKILDVLWHRPVDFVDRRFSPNVKDAPNGQIATLTLRVGKHFPNARKNQPYRVWCSDDTGAINLVFFHAHKDWITKQLPEGAEVVVSGKVEYFQGNPQMMHPDAIAKIEDRASVETVEPVYPLTAGVTNKLVRKAVHGALELLPRLPEWQDDAWKKRNRWPDWMEAVKLLHFRDEGDLSPLSPARARLAYDELLSNQLTLALVRQRQKKAQGRIFNVSSRLRDMVLKTLPFELTGAQKRAIADIDKDMGQPARMLRLLQGDVGSGKTIVACMAMLNAVESGAQAALLAPTEILARQHAASLQPLLDKAGIRFVILTGRDKGKGREVLLQKIANGAAQIVIGTHAIFQEGVEFNDLGITVIDEQHRFGVHQRLQLSAKGKGTDVLVMTATPIPRTLTLTAYGDMDVSRLDEKPPGRKPVDTRLIPKEKMDDMIDGIARQVATGARAYWVCPLVEESELIDLAAAEDRYDVLKTRFGDRAGLIHGRMKPTDKDAVKEKFSCGIMVIEHAERFGLSQLHQLRGRVGRSGDKSYCFLLYYGPLGETAKERLSIMRQTEDGFMISEKDLELRGAGDLLGVKQSGMESFRLADLSVHRELLLAAADDARLIIDKDPDLKTPRGEALRTMLYLFERDQAIQYLRSG
jgi:ATP-dependent DNA helicase RecG